MKLAAKLVSIFVLVVIILLLVDSYISYQRQIEDLEIDMEYDAQLIGLTIKGLVAEIWPEEGQEGVLRVIKEANKAEHLLVIRWVWLDMPLDALYRPKAPREKLDPVIHGQEVSFKDRDKEGNGYFYSYIPIAVDEKRPGALELSEPLSQLDEYTRAIFIRIFVLTSVLVLIGILIIIVLGIKMIGEPLNQVVDKIRRVGTGDFSGPLKLPGHNEFGELAVGLNATCEQLKDAKEKVRVETEARITALEQLRHEDRLKTVGRLASGIAHELGTPLNVISGRAGMIAKGNLSVAENMENANTIKGQSNRITTIIRQLLDFARRRTVEKTSVDLQQLLHQTLKLMAPLARKQKVDLCFLDQDDPMSVNVAPEQIQQVLMNIITNALQAMPQGGKIEMGIHRKHAYPPEGHESSEGEYVCIYVQDQGQGILEEDMEHIFEPFFTTKDTGKGTGLGLSIAYGIIREHGGWIDVKSEPGKGSYFSIYLPQEGH